MIPNVRKQSVHIRSECLEKEISYDVLLPTLYNQTRHSFPVVYLLHGLFGDPSNWLELTNLEKYTSESSVVFVFPNAENSWYCDNANLENHQYESFIVRDILRDVENRFRIEGKRDNRIIAGISMGGYGAFKIAFANSNLFQRAISMSGAFDIPLFLSDPAAKFRELHPYIRDAFAKTNEDQLQRNDLFHIFRNERSYEIEDLPFFQFSCGRDDSFLDANVRFATLLSEKNISYNFEINDGGHDWNYWDCELESISTQLPAYFAS